MQRIGEMIEKDLVYDIFQRKKKNGEIEKFAKKIGPKVIAINFEKYIAIFLGKHLTFIDSFSFMSQSLDQLSSNLSEDCFKYIKSDFQKLTHKQYKLIKKKGVYLYDYMDSFRRFSEISLPKIEDFYSILNDSHISDEEYSHAQDVWSAFHIQNLGEYHDLYLKTDVLLLADVFQNFRKTCLQYYRLDPCHYFSAPGLSWDALLRMSKINLELITDVDQQLFIEKGMRGGISYIAHRHAEANNKYMSSYNPKEESSYIMYLDANNIYGWAMSQSLVILNG